MKEMFKSLTPFLCGALDGWTTIGMVTVVSELWSELPFKSGYTIGIVLTVICIFVWGWLINKFHKHLMNQK